MKNLDWDKITEKASWLIVAILIYGIVFILIHDLNPASDIVQLLGETGTRVFFVAMYSIQASLLTYAKVFKHDRLRRHVLLSIYLAGFFLSVLGFVLNGVNFRLMSNVLVSVLAAACWMHWKFKTDCTDRENLPAAGLIEKSRLSGS